MGSFKLTLLKLQDYTFLTLDIFKGLTLSKKYWNDILREMYLIGASAIKLIFFGGLFMGIVLTIETGHQLDEFGAKTLVGRTVALGMIRELGPVITGILLAARTGAKNASEIGGMQLSEQIDAMRAFGTNPVHKLAMPRTVAAVVMFLPLTLIADITGILGGMVVAKLSLFIDTSFFWQQAIDSLGVKDFVAGLAKPLFFAFFISTISCYYGFTTRGGTTGLGRNTINAVVVSCAIILLLDFVAAKVIWEFF